MELRFCRDDGRLVTVSVGNRKKAVKTGKCSSAQVSSLSEMPTSGVWEFLMEKLYFYYILK